jgi:hypothetical protein
MIFLDRPMFDILLDSFEFFKEAKANLKRSITSKKNYRYQVLAVSWLLGLMGFRIIPLGIFKNKDEYIFENEVQTEHSADILAEGSGILLVIDCTVSVPPLDKITKIRNTINHIRTKINTKVNKTIIRVIFSAVDCSPLKDDARNKGVYIVDNKDIEFLYMQIINGHSASIKSAFYSFVA